MAASVLGRKCNQRAVWPKAPSAGQQPRTGTPAGCRGIIGPVPPPTLDKRSRFLRFLGGQISTGWSAVSRGGEVRVASQNGGEQSHTSGGNQATVSLLSNCLQMKWCFSLLTPLPSLLAFGRSGLFGPPLCGGSAPATPPLLQHAWSTGCRYS